MTATATATALPADEAPALPAAGSSFYTAMRLLPKERREAMYAVYAFCRAVDDVADDGGAADVRAAELDRWRADVDALYAGKPPARVRDLVVPVQRYDLKRADFHAVIDGMAMDAFEDIVAPDEATLDLYCDRVASAVGRLSVRIFGMPEALGIKLAWHEGRALQLTNILRDIDEDAERGRLYLPREKLAAIGLSDPTPQSAIAHPRIGEVCAAVAAEAEAHYAETWAIIAKSPRKPTKAARLMAAAYRLYLVALLKRGWAMPRARVKPKKLALVAVALRHGIV
ncbi:Presqualene diphosphate synthase [Methylobacterium cerastii]|uniref:Presqualene diphosphate synthase n=2 Tax=Methylobacterium TaxID=407 RepID=A0ABQ4QNH0_9HYPH|nr:MULTISPECIES: presqualene diphosphate synthase HpnD [Methylobacterium]TXM71038.1 presqualene diphosphate synthase HpnD [Methylobacterium sp. WL120]TXM76647.1 presqualene diphosphate synthase HpnD [Methylobacterium sp. WL12]TXN85120.1 presqualene diphosphate synthase HpnD [Methylobacterium sp. WL8]GJD46445.1 Presqualene diphosphate synthase [Methylobacterium cerastii]